MPSPRKSLFHFLLFAGAFLSLGISNGYSQSGPKIDSLNVLLKKDKADTNKVIHLNALARELKLSNPDTAILVSNEALELAEMLSYKKGIASALSNIGVCYRLKAD